MPSKTTQLAKAAGRADFRRVASLLREGADVNGSDKDGTGALLSAVSSLGFTKKHVIKGRLVRTRPVPLEAVYKTVRLLLRAGAEPKVDETPALARGQHEMSGLVQDDIGLGGAIERPTVPIKGALDSVGMDRHAQAASQ